MANEEKTPWDENAKQARASKPSTRSRLSIVLLVLILLFFGYGIFERNRLVAELTHEKAAKESIAALEGETMEADSKDWRAIFSPDRPEQAIRIGYVTLPASGPAPGYQQKVVEILEKLPCCQQLYVTQMPEAKEPKPDAEKTKDDPRKEEKVDQPKDEKEAKPSEEPEAKPAETPEKTEAPKDESKAADASLEPINIEELKKQFPGLKIHIVPHVSKGEARGPMGS